MPDIVLPELPSKMDFETKATLKQAAFYVVLGPLRL